MSVMVADLKLMDAIYRKLEYFENNTQVDVNYNEALRQFVYNSGDIKQLVKDWLYLNEWSFIRRYREDLEGKKPYLIPFLTFTSSKSLNPYEMLKHLEFLVYNIELSTIRKGYSDSQEPCIISSSLMHSYDTLVKVIESCRMRIIAELPKYKSAKWGEL